MAYADVLTGLQETIAGVSGIVHVLTYEPSSIQAFPTAYLLFDSTEFDKQGQVTINKYKVLCRLLFRWQDNAKAELELIPFVNSVPAAVAADPHLGGHLNAGMARVVTVEGMFVRVADTLFRGLDFTIEVVEKS
jgi:hypothetical protein